MSRHLETYCLESADFEAMICSDGERSLRLHSDAGEESPDTTRRYALRKRGRAERKFFATESVTENKPLRFAATLRREAWKLEG